MDVYVTSLKHRVIVLSEYSSDSLTASPKVLRIFKPTEVRSGCWGLPVAVASCESMNSALQELRPTHDPISSQRMISNFRFNRRLLIYYGIIALKPQATQIPRKLSSPSAI